MGMTEIAAVADPQGLRDQWLAQREERLAKADKYRLDERIYSIEAQRYKRARSRWGKEQFAKYSRMANTAAAKADAYERGNEDAIARIEADNATVDAALGRQGSYEAGE